LYATTLNHPVAHLAAEKTSPRAPVSIPEK
jgi:hypothetical protein